MFISNAMIESNDGGKPYMKEKNESKEKNKTRNEDKKKRQSGMEWQSEAFKETLIQFGNI